MTERVTTALAERKSVGTIHTICGVLLTDAQSANGVLPTPDKAKNTNYGNASALSLSGNAV